jgi:two-component system NtrC family sensor kinase
MEALGRMTGGVAHDFNNVLMIVQGSAELLKRRREDPARVATLADAVLAATQRGQALTRQLLAFARRSAYEPIDFDLQSRAGAIRDFLEQAVGGEIPVEVGVADDLWPLHADPDALEIALINLAVNARDAMAAGGRLSVVASNVQLQSGRAAEAPLDGDFVQIVVRDTGSGIAEEHIAHIFEPFFTTKPLGKGTGLGLSQVYGFAKQSGGAVTVASRVGAGTTFTLYLPRAAEPASVAAPGEAGAEDRPEGDGRLLVVDDEPQVRAAVTAMLEGAGYSVVSVGSAAEALERLQSDAGFDVVLTDVVMPDGLSGLELAQHVRTLSPDLPVVLMTGYSETLARGAGCPWPVLSKPFAAAEAVAALAAARAAACRPVEAPLRA